MDQEPDTQLRAATDVGTEPPDPKSKTVAEDPTPSQSEGGDTQTEQSDILPELPESSEDVIVGYHEKGKAVRPVITKPEPVVITKPEPVVITKPVVKSSGP